MSSEEIFDALESKFATFSESKEISYLIAYNLAEQYPDTALKFIKGDDFKNIILNNF